MTAGENAPACLWCRATAPTIRQSSAAAVQPMAHCPRQIGWAQQLWPPPVRGRARGGNYVALLHPPSHLKLPARRKECWRHGHGPR